MSQLRARSTGKEKTQVPKNDNVVKPQAKKVGRTWWEAADISLRSPLEPFSSSSLPPLRCGSART